MPGTGPSTQAAPSNTLLPEVPTVMPGPSAGHHLGVGSTMLGAGGAQSKQAQPLPWRHPPHSQPVLSPGHRRGLFIPAPLEPISSLLSDPASHGHHPCPRTLYFVLTL